MLSSPLFSLLDAVFPLSSNSDAGAATDMVTVIIPDSSFAQVQLFSKIRGILMEGHIPYWPV